MNAEVAYTKLGPFYYLAPLYLIITFGHARVNISVFINKEIMPQSAFFKQLTQQHPFITVCNYAGNDYVGIIQNRDDSVTTMYDYGAIVEIEVKNLFLELGDVWWGESNRLIPINLFLKEEWIIFKPYLRTFTNKSLIIVHGPVCSMSELHKRRSKRRSITIVKRLS